MNKLAVYGACAAGLLSLGAAPTTSWKGAPAAMHRLTQEQYKNSIQDIFGKSISVAGQFEPEPRADGLIAVGVGRTTVTASGLEQYDRIAKSVAGQIVDEKHRDQLIPCKPGDPGKPDEKCARLFLSKAGHLLFRRPLSQAELQSYVTIAAAGSIELKDFYAGLRLALGGMLVSPQFLFWSETAEPVRSEAGAYQLTAYSKAARLSFLLWNSTPDLELMKAAERGDLSTEAGLQKQVDRMMASPRLEVGVRAFFQDMLFFDTFDSLAKDAKLYPGFTRAAAAQTQEQTLRTIVDHLLVQNGDYRDLFTTRKTFMTPQLASLYRVQIKRPASGEGDWVPYEFPAEMPQAGILTQASFLALHSHPGTTSPTLRGKAVREILLCQKVPPPPANVDFSSFQSSVAHGGATTARQRIAAHATSPSCAGCHRVTDPLGFPLENYDTSGAFRKTENKLAIDTSGSLDGKAFMDANGLGQALRENQQASTCLVRRAFSYAAGREPSESERTWLRSDVQASFAKDGYRFPALLRLIATNPNFYRVAAPQPKMTVASAGRD